MAGSPIALFGITYCRLISAVKLKSGKSRDRSVVSLRPKKKGSPAHLAVILVVIPQCFCPKKSVMVGAAEGEVPHFV